MYSGFSVPCCSTPFWSVTNQCTGDVSTTVLYYIYMSRKILAQQSDWARGASSQGYIHNSWKKSWKMEDTLRLSVNTSNMESTIKRNNNSNNKMCHHISYYSNIPGPGGSLKHKETDNFIEDTVIHWNNSVKSACRVWVWSQKNK